MERAVDVVCRLRHRCTSRGEGEKWQRLLKSGRMLKEMNEVLPVVASVMEWVANDANSGKKVTVIDLCSGVGYLSIFLAELLAGSPRLARFVLVDSSFPQLGATPKAHHINPSHLQMEDFWPFELTQRKYDLKASSGHRQLQEHVIDRAPGPVAVLGVHLCGTLSLRAVQIFNDHPRVAFLALKPCCLPPMQIAKWQCVWQIGGHCIEAKDVCANGKYNKGKWVGGAPKSHHHLKFKLWTQHLFEGIDVTIEGHKELADIQLLPELGDDGGHLKHYQTLFAFATKPYKDKVGCVTDIGGETSRK